MQPFMALVEQAMTREPYASGTRVCWIVDHAACQRSNQGADRVLQRRQQHPAASSRAI
jgi:hypothetical protein